MLDRFSKMRTEKTPGFSTKETPGDPDQTGCSGEVGMSLTGLSSRMGRGDKKKKVGSGGKYRNRSQELFLEKGTNTVADHREHKLFLKLVFAS